MNIAQMIFGSFAAKRVVWRRKHPFSPCDNHYHDGQPFSENLLRPCPLLDNQGALAGMVERSGAHSTDLQKPEDVNDLTGKCIPAADKWQSVADELWRCSGHCAGCAAGEK